MSYQWVLLGPSGTELRSTQSFDSQEEAEAWMGREWAALVDEGAEYVSLRLDEEQVYRMGLKEE